MAAGIAAMGHVHSVTEAFGILGEKFSSLDAIGRSSVALYSEVPLGSPEADQVQAPTFVRVERLLRRLSAAEPQVTARITGWLLAASAPRDRPAA